MIHRKNSSHPALDIRHIYIEKSCADHPYTKEILLRGEKNIPVSLIDDKENPFLPDSPYPSGITAGKRVLVLARNRGRFLKPCPATRVYECCDYQVLNTGMNCPMDCSYCILQAYLNMPWLSFFVNVEDLFDELDGAFSVENPVFRRIGTGEFTDSLALDSLTRLSDKLVCSMADKQNAILELKTKTALIENLKGLHHGGRTIVAWSLNSAAVAAREELRAAPLESRLEAAARCAEWGYGLAFHFDPIIYHESWQKGYAETITKLFQTVPKDKIVWISLGALRFLPSLKPIVAARFPGSRIFCEEFVPCPDGKMRYFRAMREELYGFILERLHRDASRRTCIYLCMESNEMWQALFGYIPLQKGGLPEMLNRAAVAWTGITE